MPASRSFALSAAAPQHSSPFYQKHKMSLTQTYYLAHTARSKLSKEAARPEYDLRVLVGHANMLDGLMIELADAEREQENWFNQSVRTAQSSTSSAAATQTSKSTSITWADTLPPVLEDSSSSDEDSDESDEEMLEADEPVVTRRRAPTPTHTTVTEMELDDSSDDEEDDVAEDEESDSDELALVRTDSRSSFASPPSSPPELLHELDTEDEDEDAATPPSPPSETFAAPAPQQKQPAHKTTVALKQHDDFSRSAAHVPGLYI